MNSDPISESDQDTGITILSPKCICFKNKGKWEGMKNKHTGERQGMGNMLVFFENKWNAGAGVKQKYKGFFCFNKLHCVCDVLS